MSNSINVELLILRALWLLIAILTFNKSSVSAVFENCDYNVHISPGLNYPPIKSENYPGSYRPGSSCRYRLTAPPNHHITVTCSLKLAKEATSSCGSESFYIAVNGAANLRRSERFCGAGIFTRQSLSNTLTLAYISKGSTGNFACSLRAVSKKCECGWSITKHIANGEETSINEYPSMVALKTRLPRSDLFCSAVIISPRYLLTAAHCALYHKRENIVAWVGRHNIHIANDTIYAKAYLINRIIVHPRYAKEPLNNDIALLQTSCDIGFSRGVGPICLSPFANIHNNLAWQEVEVIGWGATKFAARPSSTLQKINVLTTDYETCKNIYGNIETIFPTQICTRDHLRGRKDSCQYDSGGPVIVRVIGRQYLVGVVSSGRGCALQDDPIGINTRVTSYLDWIHENTRDSICTIEM